MSKSVISKLVAVVSLVSLSSFVSAEAYVSYKEVPGVVTSVDAVKSTVTVTTNDGSSKVFNVSQNVKVTTKTGGQLSLSSLKKGHTVLLKNRITQPVAAI